MAGFEPLRTQHTVALTTFRRDGTAVVTPVSLVVDDQDVGTAVMRTWRTAGKAKRIRNNPRAHHLCDTPMCTLESFRLPQS